MLVTIFLRAAERAPKSLVVGAERLYLLFGHVACDLAGLRAEDWLDSGNLVARLNLPNMDPGTVDRVTRALLRLFYAAEFRRVRRLGISLGWEQPVPRGSSCRCVRSH